MAKEEKKPTEETNAEKPEEKKSDEKTDGEMSVEQKPADAPQKDEAASDEKQAEENGEGAPSGSETAEKSEKTDAPASTKADSAPQNDSEQAADNAQAQAEPTAPSTQARDMELLDAKAQLAAFKCGVRGDVVEDAVCLAMRDAQKAGKVTEKSVAEALTGVLDRHPEWKQAKEIGNNFRVGADGSKETHSTSDEISKIFGNS